MDVPSDIRRGSRVLGNRVFRSCYQSEDSVPSLLEPEDSAPSLLVELSLLRPFLLVVVSEEEAPESEDSVPSLLELSLRPFLVVSEEAPAELYRRY